MTIGEATGIACLIVYPIALFIIWITDKFDTRKGSDKLSRP